MLMWDEWGVRMGAGVGVFPIEGLGLDVIVPLISTEQFKSGPELISFSMAKISTSHASC